VALEDMHHSYQGMFQIFDLLLRSATKAPKMAKLFFDLTVKIMERIGELFWPLFSPVISIYSAFFRFSIYCSVLKPEHLE